MFRFLRSRKELTDDDLPLRVFGTPLCGRCQAVKECLTKAGIPFEEQEVYPGDLSRGLDRFHAATLLAVFTWQEEMLPAVIGHNWESVLLQQNVEEFVL